MILLSLTPYERDLLHELALNEHKRITDLFKNEAVTPEVHLKLRTLADFTDRLTIGDT